MYKIILGGRRQGGGNVKWRSQVRKRKNRVGGLKWLGWGSRFADEVELGNDLQRVLERDGTRVGKRDSLPVLHSRIHANCNHSGCQLKHDLLCSRIESRLF